MSRTLAATSGLILCGLVALLDLAGLAGIWMDAAPPLGVVLTGGALGLITLIAAILAWRGSRTAVLAVIASQVADILLSTGVYFDNRAPHWAVAVVTLAILTSLLGISLLITHLLPGNRLASPVQS
jgi:hypothetical protein